jgi:exonuclease SbcC
MRVRIDGAQAEHRELIDKLLLARQAAGLGAAVDELRKREQELADDGQRLKQEEAELKSKMQDLAGAAEQLSTANRKLKDLNDPRGRILLLEAAVAREMELRAEQTTIDGNLERLGSERQIIVEEMESYRDLDAKWAALSAERETTAEGHRLYLSNQAESALLPERQKQFSQARSNLDALSANAAEAERVLTEAEAGYDKTVHVREREQLREVEKRLVQTQSALDAAKQREAQLAAELARFAEIRQSMRFEYQQKERLEKVAETTGFIRDTLKEAAPRVARNYVYHVSVEAAQMFREITGNAEYTLKWAEDYSIVMEEDGYERPFASLSGGEQMAAALSVRLALLKQLTDIRIAFFDEPTANMDAERRDNLAMQISRITHFDQLFVISHDETFDNFVDNVISIER